MTRQRSLWFAFVLALASLSSAAGCAVPHSLGAVRPATPVNAGGWAAGGAIEYPSIDVLETAATAPPASDPSSYPTSEYPLFDFHLGHAVTDRLELQIGAQGVLYFFPIPTGAWVGGRYVVHSRKSHVVGISARAGYSGFLASRVEDPGDDATVQVMYASLAGTVKFLEVPGKPALVASVQPLRIKAEVPGAEVPAQWGVISSMTAVVATSFVSPFVTVGVITSDNTRGTAVTFSLGLLFGS